MQDFFRRTASHSGICDELKDFVSKTTKSDAP